MVFASSRKSGVHPTIANITAANVDTMTLQILQKKYSPEKPKTNVEDEKDYMKMLKETVDTFRKKSLTRQRSAYAANISLNNTTVN